MRPINYLHAHQIPSSIDELRYVADRWRMDYNHYRPHSSLDYMAPAAFAAKCLEDGSTVVVGTGAPCAAAMLVQKAHAPDLVILFEAGGFAPLLPTMPISVGDSWTYYKVVTASIRNVMTMLMLNMTRPYQIIPRLLR